MKWLRMKGSKLFGYRLIILPRLARSRVRRRVRRAG
jgi:hypothetical protein